MLRGLLIACEIFGIAVRAADSVPVGDNRPAKTSGVGRLCCSIIAEISFLPACCSFDNTDHTARRQQSPTLFDLFGGEHASRFETAGALAS